MVAMNVADENSTAPGTGPDQGRQQNDTWQVTLVVLVLLALTAVVVMLFTGSDVALKIGVVAALWAAVLGIILVARYRRQVAAVERDRELAEREHEEELRRESAAHREQEHILQQSYLESLDEYRDTALAEIREQLAAMRAQLEELSGQTWSYEPAALQAEARRIQELLAGPARATGDGGQPGYPGPDTSEAETPVPVDSADTAPRDVRDVEDVEELTPEDRTSAATPDRSSDTVAAGETSAAESRSGVPVEARESASPAPGTGDDPKDDAVLPDTDGTPGNAPDDEDTTGAFAPVYKPSWLTSPSALKPNPLITGGPLPGGGVPTDASYLIAGGSRNAQATKRDVDSAATGAGDPAPRGSGGEDASGHHAHGAHEGKGFDTGAMAAFPWDAAGRSASRRAERAATSDGSPDDRTGDVQDAEIPRHGRRRRDERGGGISVAELLENLRDKADEDQ